MKGKITVDIRRAQRQLNVASKKLASKEFAHSCARRAAAIGRTDLRSASGPIPRFQGRWYRYKNRTAKKFVRQKYHIFKSRRTSGVWTVRGGNMRKSVRVMKHGKSWLLWVGAFYRKSKAGTIGETVGTADGFYDRIMIKKINRDFIRDLMARKGSQIETQLYNDTNQLLIKVATQVNATP